MGKTSSVLFIFSDEAATIYINGLPWGAVDKKTGAFQKHKVNSFGGEPRDVEIQSLGALHPGSRIFESEQEVAARLRQIVNAAF